MLMETQRLMIRDLNDAEEEMYHFYVFMAEHGN